MWKRLGYSGICAPKDKDAMPVNERKAMQALDTESC